VNKPTLIEGALAVDDRGDVRFVNGFGFEGVRRFYVVVNHQPNFVRAWHAHRHEQKYLFVSQGAALVGAVKIDNWETPNPAAEVHRFVLSARKPSLLYIPEGHANGFKSLTADTQVVFFSNASVEESRGDDTRYPARYWDIWDVIER